MAKKVALTSSKQEILEAYNSLLNERQTVSLEVPVVSQQVKPENKITPQSSSKMMKEVADLRIALSQTLDELEMRLLSENKKLQELQETVKAENEQIENLFGIKARAESLGVLIEAHHQQKSVFEKETQEMRENWKSEKENRDKERKREEDEYSYRIKRERQKDEDDYNLKKSNLDRELKTRKENFEKDILEREASLKSQEEELKRLKILSENFSSEIAKSVKEAEKSCAEKLEVSYKHEKALLEKDYRSEVQLRNERIKALETKVVELNDQIKGLQSRVEIAESNAKDIVLKAIESSSERLYRHEDKLRYASREPEAK
ncbi:MAG TPA: hypothetical protein DCM62_06605 [Bacteroidales bacterium]|nr:hypothetical protein [Bacteroidales bacterium]